MSRTLIFYFRRTIAIALTMLASFNGRMEVQANPTGGTVTQGGATFSSAGSHFTINQTTGSAFINWQSFNIGSGETTTFVQPSSSSVVWNQINDVNPSQILGNLSANGYVFLQNQNGFYVGGQASITAHGLIMSTAAIPAPDISSGGPWSFNSPPPTAKIINFGRIQSIGGGSMFLIASDIENNGTISAPGGKIGLYAGEHVLVSLSPDGRGLSAEVSLPVGSVDNEGNLIADAGSIVAQARLVNQGGLIQANSVRSVNGTIELVASDSLNLGANSVISAKGDSQGSSDGGSVTIKSDNTYSDQVGSVINISGGAQGGNGGQVEISAPQINSIQSDIDGQAVSGFVGGVLTIDPYNIVLASSSSDPNAQYSGTVLSSDPPTSDTLTLDVNSFSPTLSQINLQAMNNITLNTLWTLTDPGVPASLTLTAGNDIIFSSGSGLSAGNNWSVNLSAGPQNLSARPTTSRTDGIYLDGNSFLQAQNGNINLWAANELLVNSGAIRTIAGGNIAATTLLGNINTGVNTSGFNYYSQAPYYTPFSVNVFTGVINYNLTALGGISTAAGGNVTISAGGDVTSYLANSSASKAIAIADPGAGAFGPEPGNVTITAGGTVTGHYVLANGVGSITAGQDIGNSGNNVALSLVKGDWNLNAPNGNIYLQEVRNPNGVFDNPSSVKSPAYHYFDYDPQASVDLTAGMGVYLTGSSLPRPVGGVPIIYPPTLDISTGSGGVNLQASIILFPSLYQNLDIMTSGGGALNGNGAQLSMADTSRTQWASGGGAFTPNDIGSSPLELNNPDPVLISVSGDMENLSLVTDKKTQISVGGNMNNCNFSGQNLHPGDATSINVGGQISNPGSFNWVFLTQPIQTLPFTDWSPIGVYNYFSLLYAAVDPTKIAALQVTGNPTQQTIDSLAASALLYGQGYFDNTFSYNPTTGRLTVIGPLSSDIETTLDKPLTVLKLDPNGHPLVVNGQFVTDTVTYNWVPSTVIQTLYTASQGAPILTAGGTGYVVGGPGEFDVVADSIALGNSEGILTEGVGGNGSSYNYLAPYTPSGAALNVTVNGDLEMPASTIAALGGGKVTVTSTGGAMDLGSQDLIDDEAKVVLAHNLALGIYTSGNGDVEVTALGDINIDSSRIATFNGGNINIESVQGSVNAGSGGAKATPVYYYFANPTTGLADLYAEQIFGSGIVAFTLVNPDSAPGSARLPGNITVNTPQGDIVSTLGGILQEALNGNISSGPTISLAAGTFPSGTLGSPDYSPGHVGNIELGSSGVIGGTVNLSANGDISGLVISRQSSTVNASQNFSGTLLSAGSADVSAGGTVSGSIIGVGGASVSGGTVSASVLGQNVSVNGGASTSTLGSSANATSTSQAASQQASQTADSQVASTDTGDDDDTKKKKQLLQKTSRVTVLLSAVTPGRLP